MKMQRFKDRERHMPLKRDARERARDFDEIYTPPKPELVAQQAARCAQCGVPFCQAHCPLHNNIPDWLLLAAAGRVEEAYEISSATNNMPEICGRICPQDRLCEGSCVVEQAHFGTVTIGAVEKQITETAWTQGWVKSLRPGTPRGATVGIIGSGPAGLAAAEELRLLGYGVTIYERADRAGGLLTYGIPNFKLDKSVVERRIKRLQEGGIEFALKTEIGEDISFEELRERHSALLLATGVYGTHRLQVPGRDLPGVISALDYLIAENRRGLGDTLDAADDARLNAHDKRVVVIGGGDTAMDCLRTAVRQGASSVRCLYRRDHANMPGSAREVENAKEEGVEFSWLAQPTGFMGESAVSTVKAQRMRLGQPNASGRRKVHAVPERSFELGADLVIEALGFSAQSLPTLFGCEALGVTPSGTVKTNEALHTSIPGVFAAGDIVRGASLVVWAIRDGREAAASMHTFIEKQRTSSKGGDA
ncbi:MAG: NAD(P)-dependent oxidoreductase [Deltaproteobacteria bacterium]|nr:NAD(P)-dependent oxidoreductase [Deltaproteobacteria bacterium]